MSARTVEFCLFVSKDLSNDKLDSIKFQTLVAQKLAACFTETNDEENKLVDDSNDFEPLLSALSCCCSPQDNLCSHANHFVLVRITSKFLKKFICQDMTDSQSTELGLHDMSCAQTTWLSELVLRTFPLQRSAFKELLELTGRNEVHRLSMRSTGDRADIFSLQQLGIVSHLVALHQKEACPSAINVSFCHFRLFPNVDSLRWYLGDSVGFYFAWMRTYTMYLIGPAILATIRLLFISSIAFFQDTEKDISTASSTVSASSLTLTVDGGYSLFMVVWALLCTKLWTRQHTTLVEKWSTHPVIERITVDMAWLFTVFDQRPEFRGQWSRDPITGGMVLHFLARKRRLCYLFSFGVIVLCLLVAGFVNAILMNLEGYIRPDPMSWLYFPCISQYAEPDGLFDPNYNGVCSYLPGVLHSLLVFVMNQVIFRKIAELLTDFENHQGQEDYERAVVVKRFLFELIDAYGCIAYLGLVLFDRHAVTSFLFTILVTDSVRRVTLECVVPSLLYYFQVYRKRSLAGIRKRTAENNPVNRSAELDLDCELHAPYYEPFDDYLEMALQHGYLVLFAYVNPIAGPILALVSTLLEAHFDAFKMLNVTQRPSPRPLVKSQFIWLALLAGQAWLSIITNVGFFCIDLTLLNLPMGCDQYSSGIVIFLLLEHGLVLLAVILHFSIADEPKQVRDARRQRHMERSREHWLLKTVNIPNTIR